jgi:YVTN family beta-propeller protein
MHLPAIRSLVSTPTLLLLLLVNGCTTQSKPSLDFPQPRTSVLNDDNSNQFFLPTGQILTPAGWQIPLPRIRPQALALSSDGRLLAVAGATEEVFLVDPRTGKMLQTNALVFITYEVRTNKTTNVTAEAVQKISNVQTTNTSIVAITNKAELSLTGLMFSPDCRRIFISNTKGTVWAYSLEGERIIGPPQVLHLPDADAPKQRKEIPSGLTTSADGSRLYVTGNLGNKLYEFDSSSGNVLRSWDTGAAPYDVVLAGHKAYVSNLGGRQPEEHDLSALAGLGMRVRVDSSRDIANEGSVTVVDLTSGRVVSEILVELHPSGLAVSPDQKYVVVANTGSDTLSVIDTANDRVAERISARQSPADLFGAQPNALTFEPSGRRLYVCNGTQNSVAVIRFEPSSKNSKMLGLIPVGWFPAAIQYHPQSRTFYVANMKGIGASKRFKPDEKVKLNSKDFFGTISCLPASLTRHLAATTQRALENMRYPLVAEALQPPRPNQPPRPVPERAGEPSVFKHVIYIIKENRTYDQVLGDMPEGNGDLGLCTFGEQYTPNQHKLAREFTLLDNTYCAGICSADGHQWTDSAMANEYVERQLTSGSPRSYSGSKSPEAADALSWASSGFIWDNALAHGKTFRNYGEWMLTHAGWSDPKKKDKILWSDFWGAFNTNPAAVQLRSRALIRTLGKYSDTNSVGWDLKVPDVMRAAEFIRELKEFETKGSFPDLIILFLPNDHTGGDRTDYPEAGSQVADNDLAFGRVVEALSHSRFWPDTCLFAIEDDPQAGWDHVSGYRTTCYVASAYSRRKHTISTQYNQISIVRSIELILGLPPMNQLDACATPMFECFTNVADLTPFNSVPNRFPLDKITPEPKKVKDRRARKDVVSSNRLPLDQPDRCPEDVLNRILWRAMKGHDVPYPEWAVTRIEDDD